MHSRVQETIPIIPENSQWRFFRGTQEPSPDLEWTQTDYDDSDWETGPSSFGFGFGAAHDATILDDMQKKCRSYF
jgi:hypothetical protein